MVPITAFIQPRTGEAVSPERGSTKIEKYYLKTQILNADKESFQHISGSPPSSTDSAPWTSLSDKDDDLKSDSNTAFALDAIIETTEKTWDAGRHRTDPPNRTIHGINSDSYSTHNCMWRLPRPKKVEPQILWRVKTCFLDALATQ